MARRPAPSLALLPLIPLALAFSPAAARAGDSALVAEQITVANAADHLFGGTDAYGGIGDWYLTNGIVELIVDDVALQDDLGLLGVVSPPPKQSQAGSTGGSLIDLARVGANDDQLVQMFTVGGLSTSNFIVYDSIGTSNDGLTARITVSGRLLGFEPVLPSDLPVVTEYALGSGDDFLTVTTTVTNEALVEAAGLGGFLDAFVWTSRALLPFSPLPMRGFDHRELDLGNPILALETPPFAAVPGSNGPADGIVDPLTGDVSGEVSYGLLGVETSLDGDGPGGAEPDVQVVAELFGVSNHELTALGNYPVGSTGLPPTGVLSYVRRLYVGERNDVAAVANPILGELAGRFGYQTGTISGNVDAADTADVVASIVATRSGGPALAAFPDGTPLTHIRTAADGSFSGVVLPEGSYDLEVRSAERMPTFVTAIAVTAGQDTQVTIPALSGLGAVEVELVERRKGPDQPIPGKLVFKGRKGDPDPEFGRDIEAFDLSNAGDEVVDHETFGGSLAQGNTAYLTGGATTLSLRPGRYEVYASRGPEYSVQRKTLVVKEGKRKRLKFVLDRLVETPGALSGDFHIHSARSLDTQAGLEARVASFAGENVEVMVSTDHDFVLDYGPVIDALELAPFVNSIVGVEVTGSVPNPPAFPDSTGHINAWPMTPDATAHADGAIQDEFVAPNFIFSRLRDRGAEVIQYNHPRAGTSGLTSIGFFNNFGYRPDLPITDPPNDLLLDDDVTGDSGVANPDGYRNLDFDVLEIGNGPGVTGWLETRADWISLLRQIDMPDGPVPFHPGTGVSDSHRVTVESAGYFRSYVLGSGDDPTALDVPSYNQAIKQGRMVVTTGPYLEVSLDDGAGGSAGVGETLTPAGAGLTLHVRVQASPWVPVDEVRVLVNGEVPAGLAFDTTTNPKLKAAPKKAWSRSKKSVERFDASIPLDLGGSDAFVIVEAGVKLDPLPDADPFGELLVPGYRSIAFANPIFVDFAGDGFDGPGVSAPLMAELRAPLETPRGRAAAEAKRAEDVRDHPSIYQLRIPAEALGGAE
jgi:hypothetical protein